MQEPQSVPGPGAARDAPDGRSGIPHRPVDRSRILRRSSRYPFSVPIRDGSVVRIRRDRRVGGPFSAIPPLARLPEH